MPEHYRKENRKREELEFLLLQNGDGGAGNSQQSDHNTDHIAGIVSLGSLSSGVDQCHNLGIGVLCAVEAAIVCAGAGVSGIVNVVCSVTIDVRLIE